MRMANAALSWLFYYLFHTKLAEVWKWKLLIWNLHQIHNFVWTVDTFVFSISYSYVSFLKGWINKIIGAAFSFLNRTDYSRLSTVCWIILHYSMKPSFQLSIPAKYAKSRKEIKLSPASSWQRSPVRNMIELSLIISRFVSIVFLSK